MAQKFSGFVCDIMQPKTDVTRYVACIVVTPYRNGKADVKSKTTRNIGRKKALQLAIKLLKRCDASPQLIAQVEALAR